MIWSNPMVNLFRNDFWGTPIDQNSSHKSYRPLCVLTFKINHYFHQFDASGYHLVNLVFHCLVCLLYTSLLKRWTYKRPDRSTSSEVAYRSSDRSDGFIFDTKFYTFLNRKQLSAFNLVVKQLGSLNLPPLYLIASVLFCVHPIHVEAVAGLVGRADIGCALFFLLSLHFYDNYLQHSYESRSNESDHHLTNELNGRGRNEYKERRLMQSIHLEADTKSTTKWSTYLRSLIQLYSSIVCGLISMLFKEYGLTVFAFCAFYHLITHCNYLAYLNQSSGERLVNLNLFSRRRWQTYKLTATKQDKLSARLQSTKERSKCFAFGRCLHAILCNVS